jgi:hypothetical protein
MPRRRLGWGSSSTENDPAAAAREIDRHASELSTAALTKISERLTWYRTMPAELRSWVGVILQAAISSFAAWYAEPTRHKAVSAEVFGAAPPELTRAISLEQVVQMARVAIDAVEESLDDVVGAAAAPQAREAMLRYSREIAFAAATVYARAAEERGAWDARLEALVMDAVLRDETDEAISSQAAALRWPRAGGIAVVVGSAPMPNDAELLLDGVRAGARGGGHSALVGVHADRMVVLLDNAPDPVRAASSVLDQFGPQPVVVGPRASTLAQAAASARSALAGLRAARGWPDAPRPVQADALLPERVLAGEVHARELLVTQVYAPLAADRGPLLETVEAYLSTGGSIEAASRRLLVHPNTVRYRLRRASDLSGWSATDPRGQFVLRIALTLGQLSETPTVEGVGVVVELLQSDAQ